MATAPARTTPRWLWPLLLALPFLVAVAVLRGLTVEIDTFHASDARVYQLPTIVHFSHRLDFSSYPSAQTPLFHLLMAGWGKLVGFELWRLRLLNVAISYAMALALFRLLRRATRLDELQAFALTLVFVLSPYVFGASFTLLTDNLAILFALLALERLHAFRTGGSLLAFAAASAAIAGAVLTRQSFLWLVLLALAVLVLAPVSSSRRLAGAGTLAVALVPLAALVADWGGLVPPGADPSSCGLCTDRPGVGRDALTLRAVGFSIALLGGYAAAVHGPRLVRLVRERGAGAVTPGRVSGALAALAALVPLALDPLRYRPAFPHHAGDAGYLWQLSDHLPTLAGSSLLLLVLVPAGALATALLVRRAGPGSLGALYLGSFLIAVLPVGLVYQKYFDPFMLLALALLARPGDLRRRGDYAGLALLAAGSVAYALSFAG